MGEATFTHALLDPTAPVPEGLTDAQGRPAGRRFSVYRNNVAVALTEALLTGFPLLHRLLGAEFFQAMAAVYRHAHPPRSPRLALYGTDMPAFLAAFSPVAHLPYLPDVARLEIALRDSYHAADAQPVDPAMVAALPPDRLLNARLRLAPSLRVIRSDWPLFGIWARETRNAPDPVLQPEDVLITRPAFDPRPAHLPPGGAAFIDAISHGATLEAAQTAAGEAHDPTATLTLLIAGAAITGLEAPA